MNDSLLAGILTNHAVEELTKTIKDLDEKNTKLERTMLWLTMATVLLAIVQIIIALLTFL